MIKNNKKFLLITLIISMVLSNCNTYSGVYSWITSKNKTNKTFSTKKQSYRAFKFITTLSFAAIISYFAINAINNYCSKNNENHTLIPKTNTDQTNTDQTIIDNDQLGIKTYFDGTGEPHLDEFYKPATFEEFDFSANKLIEKFRINGTGEKLFNGRKFPALDICIILDNGIYINDGYTRMLTTAITQEEAIITSSNAIQPIIKSKSIFYNETLKNLNNKEKWIKLITNDQNFLVLIPKKKYNIKDASVSEIEKISLNSNILKELDFIDNKIPEFKGKIAHETLLKIFSESPKAKKIMKRIYLGGHGWKQSSNMLSETTDQINLSKDNAAYIAQLSLDQYSQLLKKLNEIGCSFLYVSSCYACGLNTISAQNNINKESSFITILENTNDKPSLISQVNINYYIVNEISNFFILINNFFEEQRNKLKESFTEENKQTINNIDEIDILTGKYVTHLETNKTPNEQQNNIKINLIDQKPWLINSFEELRKNIIGSTDDSNIISIKFPGMPFFRASSKIDSEDFFYNTRIDYPMLLKHDILLNHDILRRHEILNKKIEIKSSKILVYPSIITIPINIKSKNNLSVLSMIPGRAQHYIKEIILDAKTKRNKENCHQIFESQHSLYSGEKNASEATKLYFIEKLSCEKDGSIFKNLIIKTNINGTEYIYKDNNGNYIDTNGQKIRIDDAKRTIKNWIMSTTPAKESIHEATAGIENIFKFRTKISQITKEENGLNTKDDMFENMFSPRELGKN